MVSVPLKPCRTCGIPKHPENDYYLKDKRTGRRDSECNTCKVERSTAYRNARPGYKAEQDRVYRERHPEENKQYRAANHDRIISRQRKSYAERRESILAQRRADRAALKANDPARYQAFLDAKNARRRADYAARPDVWKPKLRAYYEANREAHNRRVQSWGQRNRDKRVIYVRRHEAHKRGNGGTFTDIEWQVLKAAQGYTCLRCGRREPDIKLTIDHVVPVSKGGRNSAENIQGLCHSCNSGKRDRTIDYRP